MKKASKQFLSLFLSLTMILSILVCIPGISASANDYDSSIIAHFPLRGDTTDASGNGHTLNINSGTWVDNSLFLAGGSRSSNQYATFENDLLKNQNSVTVSMWIKNNNNSGNLTAFFFGSAAGTGGSNMPKDYILLVPSSPSGQYKTHMVNANVTSNPYNSEVGYQGTDTTKYFGVWTNYSMVISPTEIIAYINGQRLGSANHTRQISDYVGTLNAYLGASNYTSDSLFSGYFRDVRFYSSALSDDQMHDLYMNDAPDYVTIDSCYSDGDELPTQFAGIPVTWEAEDGVSVVDGKIVADSTLKVVTITAAYGEVTKSFEVTILPKAPVDSTTVFAYVDAKQSAQLGYSMHYAVLSEEGEVTPLNFGDGVLFAPADWETQINTGYIQDYDASLSTYSYGGKRSLENPWMFRMADGKIGVVAEQRAYDDALPANSDRSLFFWVTENLLDFEYKGKITPYDKTISKPQVEYDDGTYYISWEAGSEIHEVSTTDFASFSNYSTSSTHRSVVPAVIDGSSCAFEASAEEYELLLKKLTPVTNTEADNLAELDLAEGDSLTLDDLPQTFKAYYSDGSEADMPIKWDSSVLSSVDTSTPGLYTITGEAAYDQYDFPFITNRADPCIKYYDGYYYFIATYDATGGSGANAYQRSLRIRRATTIEGLASATESIILSTADSNSLKWAPELHVIDGKLSVLIAISSTSASWNRVHCSIMTLKDDGDPLVASDWNAPVTVKRTNGTQQIQTDGTGITLDMTYFEDGGNHYYMWSQRFVASGQGTADLYIAKFDPSNPSVLTTDPVCILRPTYGWERPGSSRVEEGPYMLEHDGRKFVTFSSAMVDSTYCVGLLEAMPGTDLTDPDNWKVTGYPLLTSSSVANQYGPGHNAYTVDEYGRDVFVFHARSSATAGSSTSRHTGLRTVHWAFDGTPVLYMTADQQLKSEYRTFTMLINVSDSSIDPGDTEPADDYYADTYFSSNVLTAGEELTATTYFTNATGSDLSGFAIDALYSGDGRLIKLSSLEFTVGAMSTDELVSSIALPDTLPSGAYVKRFIWDSSYCPLTPAALLSSPATIPETLEADYNSLSLSSPSGSVLQTSLAELPTSGAEGSTITWKSTDPSVLTTFGRVIRPITGEKTAALVALITAPTGERTTKIFVYTIASASDISSVRAQLDKITLDGDYENFAYDAVLQSDSDNGCQISWQSSDESIMASNGLNNVTDDDKHPVTLTVTVTKGSASASKTFDLLVVKSEMYGYLFAYFTGNGSGEQIYFGLSRDGYQWTELANRKVVSPTVGSTHVRDPFIIKGPAPNGTIKYYMLGTDLDTRNGASYTNTALYTWESTDLINWSKETRFVLAGSGSPYEYTRPSGVAWAPEAVWDPNYQGDGFTGAYLMYWTSNKNGSAGNSNHIVYSYTRDFKTLLTEPAYLYSFQAAEVTAATTGQTMDASIHLVNGKYYMFYRKDGNGIYRVEADSITGKQSDWSNDTPIITGAAWEGPDPFQLIGSTGENGWILLADKYSSGTTNGNSATRFSAFIGDPITGTRANATNNSGTGNFAEIPSGTGSGQTNINTFMSSGRARHGAVVQIDETRFRALWKEYLGVDYTGN